jgi:hypothetical protein
MRPLQDEVIDTMLVEDYTNLATSVSGINDSSYNSFPSSTFYSSGFAPTQVEPISVIAEEPNVQTGGFAPTVEPYIQGFAPAPIQESPMLRPAGKCTRVIFTAIKGIYTGDASYAYWTDCSGIQKSQFVSDDETLEVDALDGTAFGLPFMSYPIGQTPLPIAYEPVDPIAPTPIYTELPITDGVSSSMADLAKQYDRQNAQSELIRTEFDDKQVQDVIGKEAFDKLVAAKNLKDTIGEEAYSKLDKDTILQASQKPASETLPTKPASETLPTKESMNLKPYIIVGVLVVGILIASRLFSKK